jgi:hypothetical protein
MQANDANGGNSSVINRLESGYSWWQVKIMHYRLERSIASLIQI